LPAPVLARQVAEGLEAVRLQLDQRAALVGLLRRITQVGGGAIMSERLAVASQLGNDKPELGVQVSACSPVVKLLRQGKRPAVGLFCRREIAGSALGVAERLGVGLSFAF
jgi:hypothetical protein